MQVDKDRIRNFFLPTPAPKIFYSKAFSQGDTNNKLTFDANYKGKWSGEASVVSVCRQPLWRCSTPITSPATLLIFFFIMIIIFILWIITMSRWHAWQSCNFDSMRYLQDVHEPVVPGAELTESLPFPFPSYLLVEGTLQFVKTVVANERFIFASISLDFLSFVRFVHPWKQAFLIRGPQRCFKLASSWE